METRLYPCRPQLVHIHQPFIVIIIITLWGGGGGGGGQEGGGLHKYFMILKSVLVYNIFKSQGVYLVVVCRVQSCFCSFNRSIQYSCLFIYNIAVCLYI